MLVFIDESGIHKAEDDSTFALVYVEVEDFQALENSILELEKKLGIPYFHWSATVWHVKEQFMNEALRLDFKVKIAVIGNPVNPPLELERVLTHMLIERAITNIIIDGKKPKWYERRLKKILRDKGISVRKLRTKRAHQSAGVRVADMVAGPVRSYFDGKHPERIAPYYKRMEKKIQVLIQ